MDKKDICLRLDSFDYVMLSRYAGLRQMSLQQLVRSIIKDYLYRSVEKESNDKILTDKVIDIDLDSDTTLHYDIVNKRFVF